MVAGDVALLPAAACRKLLPILQAAARTAHESGRRLDALDFATLRVVRDVAATRPASDIGSAEAVDGDVSASSTHERITVNDAATRLGVTPRRVTQLLAADRLTGYRSRPGAAWLVDLDSVDHHLEQRDTG